MWQNGLRRWRRSERPVGQARREASCRDLLTGPTNTCTSSVLPEALDVIEEGRGEVDCVEGAGCNQRDAISSALPRRRPTFLWAALLVPLLGLSILAVVLCLRAPQQPDELAVFVANAPPEVATLVREAIDVAHDLVERFPDDPDALNVMAWVHFRFGGSDEAVAYWQKCLELDPRFVDAYFSMASAARDRGDHEQAAEYFRKAWELDPAWPSLAEHLAEALMNLGRLDDAADVLEQNIKTHPRAMRSSVLLGDIYAQLGEYEKAKQRYEAAIRVYPGSASAYYGAASACIALGKTDESKQLMEKFNALKASEEQAHRDAVQTHDGVFPVRFGVAEVYVAAGRVCLVHDDPQTAERCFRRGAEVYPQHPECSDLLASLYDRQGRTHEAIAALRRWREHDPENRRVYSRLGSLYARLGDFEGAEEAFVGAIRAAPQEGRGYAALAGLYLQADRKLPEAKTLAQEAVEHDPRARHYLLLSLACQKNGELGEARSAIEQAAALEPGNPEFQRVRQTMLGQK